MMTSCPILARCSAVFVASSPLGSMTSAEPVHVSRLGMSEVADFPALSQADVHSAFGRSVIRPAGVDLDGDAGGGVDVLGNAVKVGRAEFVPCMPDHGQVRDIVYPVY